MHAAVWEYVFKLKSRYPGFFLGRCVLEVGARDVNGSAQDLFEICQVIGVDMIPGLRVKLVGELVNLDLPTEYFDVVFSTEALEHDPKWKATLRRMYELLRPAGLFFFTCATTGRQEHGTLRSDGDVHSTYDYYHNLTQDDVQGLGLAFKDPEFQINPKHGDLYFSGLKP
jgi:SAM-dependent methyltransferase